MAIANSQPSAVPDVDVAVEYRGELGTSTDADSSSSASPAIAAAIPEECWQSWFQIWLSQLAIDLSPINAYELSLLLTDDAEIQQLNAQFRHQDKPTDVLSFAALEAEGAVPDALRYKIPLNLGDIIISIDTAQRQARERGHSLRWELAWLATHGLLHLLGWDHPTEERLQEMLDQQDVLLDLIDLAEHHVGVP